MSPFTGSMEINRRAAASLEPCLGVVHPQHCIVLVAGVVLYQIQFPLAALEDGVVGDLPTHCSGSSSPPCRSPGWSGSLQELMYRMFCITRHGLGTLVPAAAFFFALANITLGS